jgi:hypothetical protein
LQPGWYVTVHIVGVPESLNKARQLYQPLVLVGLLPHEQKMSVLNFVIRRPNVDKHNQQIIKSKEQLIFHCGYRRFKACPVFSQHTNGTKHKVSTLSYLKHWTMRSTVQHGFHIILLLVKYSDHIACTSEMIRVIIHSINMFAAVIAVVRN